MTTTVECVEKNERVSHMPSLDVMRNECNQSTCRDIIMFSESCSSRFLPTTS